MSKILVIHPDDRSTDFLKPVYHGRSDATVLTGGCSKDDVAKAIDAHDHIVMMGHGTPQGLLSMGKFPKTVSSKVAQTPSQIHAKVDQKVLASLPKKGAGNLYGNAFNSANEFDDGFGFEDQSTYSKPQYGNYSGSFGGYGLTSSYVIDKDTVKHLRGRNKKLTAIWCNADQFIEWNDLGGFYTGMFISEESEATLIGCENTDKWMVEQQNYAFVEIVRQYLDRDPEVMRKALFNLYGPLADRNPIARYNLRRFFARTEGQDIPTLKQPVKAAVPGTI